MLLRNSQKEKNVTHEDEKKEQENGNYQNRRKVD